VQALQFGFFGCLGIIGAVALGVVGLIVLSGIMLSNDEGAQELISGDAGDISVRIEGTRGLAFTGAIGSFAGNRSIEGTVPESYTLDGEGSRGIFTVILQKMSPNGTLRVTLMCREGAQSSETKATYGAVSVACTP
jgi:hypothetical protein